MKKLTKLSSTNSIKGVELESLKGGYVAAEKTQVDMITGPDGRSDTYDKEDC